MKPRVTVVVGRRAVVTDDDETVDPLPSLGSDGGVDLGLCLAGGGELSPGGHAMLAVQLIEAGCGHPDRLGWLPP
jgi:hypothetical protein